MDTTCPHPPSIASEVLQPSSHLSSTLIEDIRIGMSWESPTKGLLKTELPNGVCFDTPCAAASSLSSSTSWESRSEYPIELGKNYEFGIIDSGGGEIVSIGINIHGRVQVEVKPMCQFKILSSFERPVEMGILPSGSCNFCARPLQTQSCNCKYVESPSHFIGVCSKCPMKGNRKERIKHRNVCGKPSLSVEGPETDIYFHECWLCKKFIKTGIATDGHLKVFFTDFRNHLKICEKVHPENNNLHERKRQGAAEMGTEMSMSIDVNGSKRKKSKKEIPKQQKDVLDESSLSSASCESSDNSGLHRIILNDSPPPSDIQGEIMQSRDSDLNSGIQFDASTLLTDDIEFLNVFSGHEFGLELHFEENPSGELCHQQSELTKDLGATDIHDQAYKGSIICFVFFTFDSFLKLISRVQKGKVETVPIQYLIDGEMKVVQLKVLKLTVLMGLTSEMHEKCLTLRIISEEAKEVDSNGFIWYYMQAPNRYLVVQPSVESIIESSKKDEVAICEERTSTEKDANQESELQSKLEQMSLNSNALPKQLLDGIGSKRSKVTEITSILSDSSSSIVQATGTISDESVPSKLVEEEQRIDTQKYAGMESTNKMSEFSKRYKLGEDLGKGSYSVVKRAVEVASGMEVAIKCVPKDPNKESMSTELKYEVSILQELDHPNLLKFIGFFEDEAYYYLVTELVSGGELFDRIVEKEYFPEHEVQAILRVIGDGLKYLHDKGIVHCNLKPENIMLTSRDTKATFKIIDFGFAKKIFDSAKLIRLETSLEAPFYFAPEIIKGKAYGTSVDMWSVGVIFYILLCGYPPFYDENQQNLLQKIKTGEFLFDEPYWNHISDDAKDLISHLLVVDPAQRYSIAEFLGHPWMASDRPIEDLTPDMIALRNYQRRLHLKTGTHAMQTLSKMRAGTII